MDPSVATRLDDPTPRPSPFAPTSSDVSTVNPPDSDGAGEQPPSPPPAPATPRRKRHRVRRVLFKTLLVLLTPILLSWFLVLSMNFWALPRTSFMLQEGEPLAYQYVGLDNISRYVVGAAIAHEDQVLGTRSGPFDWKDFNARVDAYMKGEDDPSGSTVPQQLAKNIFLWPGQDPVRKGLEVGLSYEVSYSLSPKRIMELYLNYAQFGPHLFGICAASWYYFKTPPWAMTPAQAARLMGVVPFPDIVYRGPDGGAFIDKAKNPKSWNKLNGAANVWVPRQLEGMGGWQAAVLTIGIRDLASDHQAERDAHPDDPDTCSTWPDSVVERYNREGILIG